MFIKRNTVDVAVLIRAIIGLSEFPEFQWDTWTFIAYRFIRFSIWFLKSYHFVFIVSGELVDEAIGWAIMWVFVAIEAGEHFAASIPGCLFTKEGVM